MTGSVNATDLVSIWREVADGFTARLVAVQPHDWAGSTCCTKWDVAALVDHAIGTQRLIPKALGSTGAIDTSGDDRGVVWEAVRPAANAALAAPGALAQRITLSIGEMTAEDALVLLTGDLLVHTWDLARAVGADDHLHPQACAMTYANLEPLDDMLRAPGFYGPKIEPAQDADLQDRLLSFLGRRV